MRRIKTDSSGFAKNGMVLTQRKTHGSWIVVCYEDSDHNSLHAASYDDDKP
jgi:hypothetical protein